jgi:phosphodiesterase/alkaline phosphatase D-like protein
MGPYADTVPPITEKVNCDSNYFPGCKPGSITSTTATIFWTTYEPATSQVGYGINANSLRASPADKSLVLSHSVQLNGLQPGTTYHFRVRSVDKAGLEATNKDLTFTTLPASNAAPSK